MAKNVIKTFFILLTIYVFVMFLIMFARFGVPYRQIFGEFLHQSFDAASFYQSTRLKMVERCEDVLVLNCSDHLQTQHFRQPSTFTTSESQIADADTRAILKAEVVLVVTFNRVENFVAVANLDLLYRHLFLDVYFCGPSADSEQAWYKAFDHDRQYLVDQYNRSFLSYGKHEHATGEMVFFCFNKAIDALQSTENFQKLRGVVFVPEDTVFNYWNINVQKMDFDKSWMKSHHSIYDIDLLVKCPRPDSAGAPSVCNETSNLGEMNWTWPRVYLNNVKGFYESLESEDRWKDQYQRLVLATGGERRVMALGTVDFFYIAKAHFQLAYDSFSLMANHHLYMEIAMATAFAILEPRASFKDSQKHKQEHQVIVPDLRGHNSGAKRKSAPERYHADYFYVHPFKLSRLNLFSPNFSSDNETFETADACLYCVLLIHNFAA